MKKITLFLFVIILFNCKTTDDYKDILEGATGNAFSTLDCDDAIYTDWESSKYALPYAIGTSYTIGLSHCSGSYHSFGQPDQFAIDFNMSIGTLIKASRSGTVVFVEESGQDYGFPNNKVVVRHADGTYGQYMHLTRNGAQVSEGQAIPQGGSIGFSGATGLAGYPHLHFVVTENGAWEYPYISAPVNFINTTENPRSLIEGMTYEALPF